MVRPAASRLAAVVLTVLAVLALAGCEVGSTARRDSVPASPAKVERVHRYVALGDSYTAAPLVPVTDVADGCFRSTGNYPSRVARTLGAHLVDRSCSGAATADLWRRQAPGLPPQLDAVDARTDLVTLGIGGNDAEVFRRMLETCASADARTDAPSLCRNRMSAADGRNRLLEDVGRARAQLVRAVGEIHRRAPHARVMLVGYPQLIAAGRTCAGLPLEAGDYAFARQINRALDQNLRYAAHRARAAYVDVWTASRGHDICAADPWVNGSASDQRRAAAFHPFAAEQKAVARLVVRALRGNGAA